MKNSLSLSLSLSKIKDKIASLLWKIRKEGDKIMNKYLQQDLDEKIKERDKRFTKFIIFLVLWLLSGIIFLIIWFLSALTLGLVGVLFGWILGLGASITFLILWIYNLVRFLSVNGEVKQLEAEIKELG